MPTYQFPVLVWEDHEGYFTASLLDWDQTAAVDLAPSAALAQLKACLSWQYKQNPDRDPPDFLDPKLAHFTVPIRPEYDHRGRRYACNEVIRLRIPCVCGHEESGLSICGIPTLRIRFYYYEPEGLESMVTHHVRDLLTGSTPQELSRYLPPKNATLETISVQVPRRRRAVAAEFESRILPTVAEALEDRSVKRHFSRPWGRDAEVKDLVKRLAHEKVNVILVGESGVGKTSVLVEAARKIDLMRDKPSDGDGGDEGEKSHKPGRMWLTGASRLIAGMKYLGEWQERCEEVIRELSGLDSVLCVDNLLELVRVGGEGAADSLAAFFLPYLQRNELRMVAEATPAELDACRRLLPGLAGVFQILKISDFVRRDALEVLQKVAESHRRNEHIDFEKGVVPLVYRLFARFVPYQAFPGRSATFIDRLFEEARRRKGKHVSIRDVIQGFVRETGLPELLLRDDILLEQAEVEAALQREVIGQPEACEAAACVVCTCKSGLNDPKRPLAVLLFCGPTGVGKTELAKALSRYFFGHGKDTDRLVRLDMSEYAGPGAAARLLGESDGEPSDFIKRMRRQPFAVVLLDEIEKAAPEVFDLLLGVLDEGRLTDRWGRTTVFRSAVIIMTSNLGAQRKEPIGYAGHPAAAYDEEAMKFFRPEFYNRIDEVVTFRPLDKDTIRAITVKELHEIAEREGLKKRGLRLTWTDAVVGRLAKEGFDARYGARPLQRMLEKAVVTPLARYLLEHRNIRDVELRMELADGQCIAFAQR